MLHAAAFAQPPSGGIVPSPADGTMARARSRYEAGLELASARSWDDAARAFRESYELVPTAPALVNLVLALSEAGRCAEVRAAAAALESNHPGLDEAISHRARAASVACTATLELRGVGDAPIQLTIDGAPREDDGARPIVLALDPGAHEVRLFVRGHEDFVYRDRIEAGHRASILVALRASPLEAASSPARDTPSRRPKRRRIAFVTAGAVALIGASFGIAFGLHRSERPPDADDTLHPR
jgi:hypothetical protein